MYHLIIIKIVRLQDLPGEVKKLAEFLNKPVDNKTAEAIARVCTFSYVKQEIHNFTPMLQVVLRKGRSGY